MKTRYLLLGYAVLNAILYSSLLPLWEGFDEPFHYGYVQHLASGQGFPDPRTTLLSREIAASLLLVPGSHVVKANLPQVVTFREYFLLPCSRKSEMRQELSSPSLSREVPNSVNYEAHHAPLAYVLMAIPERLASGLPLPQRVLLIRLLVSVAGSLLLYFAAARLGHELGLPIAYRDIGSFCILSLQMTWATIAHVANDWLALPVAVWVLVWSIRSAVRPQAGTFIVLALVLGAGLLTKAYFLALTPLLLVPAVARASIKPLLLVLATTAIIAGPWYLRNVVRYGVITGMQESRARPGPDQLLQSAVEVDWQQVIPASARAALWTGNNTFSTFSVGSLNAVLGLCGLAFLLWVRTWVRIWVRIWVRTWPRTRHDRGEAVTSLYCGLFLLALAWSTILSCTFTRQCGVGPSPWYVQPLVTPLVLLGMLGLARAKSFGRLVGTAFVLVFGYLLAATYAVKLIPLYGGYEGTASPGVLFLLYSSQFRPLLDNIGSVALAPARVVLLLTVMTLVLNVTLQLALVLQLYREDPEAGDRAS